MKGARAAVLLAALSPQAHAQASFATSIETVYVDAFVTRDRAPVANLTAADFEVQDNGVKQEVRLEDVGHMPITATLALDVSGSVEGERLAQLRLAGHAFVEHLAREDQVGLLAFSHRLRLTIPHTRDAASVHRGLDAFKPAGETALYDALYASLLLPTGPGRTLIVAFTDGQDTISWLDGRQVLEVAQASNALVHIVTISSSGREALERITQATGGRMWNAQNESLPQTFVSIVDELRTRYLLAYEPRGGPREGHHKLDVRVRGGKGEVRARSGYFVAHRP